MGRDRNGPLHDQNDDETEGNEDVLASKTKSKSKSRESFDSDSEEDRKHVKRDKGKRKSGKRRRSRSDEDSESDSDSEYSSSSSEYSGNKRPEFTAWLAEVKQVNLESLPNWEEKQMFKEFMEDHNTATFPSKKSTILMEILTNTVYLRNLLPCWFDLVYYNLDAYHKNKMIKEHKKGMKKVLASERTVFNDEEQRRLELLQAREKQKEEEVETLKKAMQSGMAQAMKEQAQLREEMAYQYKLGNHEAAAAIQRRLDPDIAM
ncbi:hypothetical protein JRO89_XS15G0118100 [Xanthoceras sorbifolium]|uniref:Uncharacterized protein n=1 Tax=Xanthoceras sorbifolium TaxID=99658 RepID=A0ABQ8H1S0_9ROSI|nr:hypothetical protein JRO89_XS15G0118100 [Xanthoceras sorbifolium]